jgi:hypothetical protein
VFTCWGVEVVIVEMMKREEAEAVVKMWIEEAVESKLHFLHSATPSIAEIVAIELFDSGNAKGERASERERERKYAWKSE